MTTDPAKLLKKYQDEGYNILTPAITLEGLSPHHKATVETLSLSPDPDYGDVYKDKNSDKLFIVKKQGLDKLAVLGGILWPDREGSRRIDDNTNRDYIAFEAFGAIRKADGQLVPCKASYDMDLVAIEEDLQHQYREKGSKGQYAKKGQELEDYVNYCVGRDMRSIRKHKGARCESGARNRVIRALLGLKTKYSKVELQKPFVAVRITYQPDYNDPEVKRLITMMSLGAQGNVFGMSAPRVPLPAPQPTETYDHSAVVNADIVPPEDFTNQNGYQTERGDEPFDNDEGAGDVDDLNDNFGLWDRKSQNKHIEELAEQKGYDLKGLLERMKLKGVAGLSEIEILQVKDRLASMPDKPPSNIPF